MRRLCKVMALHPSGYYAWRIQPESKRSIEDRRLLGHIKQSWLESGAIYGYRKVHDDLRELGESCGHNRVYRLMRQAAIRSQAGYRQRPGHRSGPAAVVAPNRLQQQFDVAEPNRVWVIDISVPQQAA
jgi:putative transposase